MRNIHQLNRSHFTISIMALMLIVSLSGMGFAADGRVDLNTSTAKELQQLPGIGKGLAKRIVDYRTANGPFKTVEDLIKVKGIGKKMFAKMQDRLTVGSSPQVAASE
ncbi:MAG: helix-hairpin-helix domain-containing protein [Nitrospira sp.]|nr:helix-hairpin-helix domain-containing protein [Nitrospira sp.]MCY3954596.1 helix-hairpin-helix domain-containing protein [Nitrospira sp.]MCY4133006.1 helix-hairpin-helix domain-containing protein [Nitrospira sp.]